MSNASKVYTTVEELIQALKAFPPDTKPIIPDPLFDGVRLVAQDDGSVLIINPPRDPKDMAQASS